MLRSAGDCTRCGETYCNGDGDAYGAAEATVCLVNDNIGASKALRALLESTRLAAARIGLMITFVRIYFSVRLNLPVLDGAASILIGLVLAVTAVLLARETKGLLIGERADQRIHDSILRIAGGIEGVAQANGVLTIHLAPQQILVALSLEFADGLRTP